MIGQASTRGWRTTAGHRPTLGWRLLVVGPPTTSGWVRSQSGDQAPTVGLRCSGDQWSPTGG
jgi:hypothetical protein